MAKKEFWMGQEIQYGTEMFGKPYVCLKDVDGTIYFLRLDENGQPILTD